jgi:diguanylate cyclase (GGDEF)-like protein
LNDKHGHLVGDEALKILADALRENSRSIDVASRMSGDEFVLLLPDTEKNSCGLLGARITRAAEKIFSQRAWNIALSFGHVTEIGKTKSVDALLRAAEDNMKMNKQGKD